LVATYSSFAQNLDQISFKDKKPVVINGGLSLAGTAYKPFGMDSRRDPFSYTLSLNINFRLFDLIDAPFSMFLMSQNKTFSTPSYNITGISPKYKWITVHAGWRNMQFSQYSCAGINFLGGGVELQPETFPIRGKVFYGRLQKVIPFSDTITGYMQEPAFERFGGAGAIEIGSRKNNVEFIFFRAADKEKSLVVLDSNGITPQENMVLELRTKQTLYENITFAFSYAFSAYTRDTRMPQRIYEGYTYADNFGFLFRPRESSFFSSVYDGQLDYSHQLFNVGVSYRRVDPNYQSMGALYMTNDVEETQANFSTALFENKINFSASGGIQRNNLDKNLESEERRFISNVNLAFTATENLNFTVNYANFNTSTSPSQIILFDSIKFVQVTNNFGVAASYMPKIGDLKHNFTLAVAQQGMNTINNEFSGLESTNNIVQTFSFNYQTLFPTSNLSVSAGISYNIQDMPEGKINAISPVISLGRPFFNRKIRTSLSWTESFSRNLDGSTSVVNVFRLSASGKILKKHNINFSTNYMNRQVDVGGQVKKSGEWMATLTYAYSF
jgi:hypothetical protein